MTPLKTLAKSITHHIHHHPHLLFFIPIFSINHTHCSRLFHHLIHANSFSFPCTWPPLFHSICIPPSSYPPNSYPFFFHSPCSSNSTMLPHKQDQKWFPLVNSHCSTPSTPAATLTLIVTSADFSSSSSYAQGEHQI